MSKRIKNNAANIERVNSHEKNGAEAIVELDTGEILSLIRQPNFDYFLVNTDDFAPHAHKGSVVEVFTCRDTYKATDVVLVAGNKRLEILPYSKAEGCQIIGTVYATKSWPGRVVRNYEP